MDKLIELLQQIQELAGVAVDALQGAGGGHEGGKPPEHGGPPHEGGKPGGGAPEGGKPPEPDGDEPKQY